MIDFSKICLTTILSYAALFLAARLVGRKQISQLDFFDYVTGITIGSIAAELATNLEEMWKPLTALVIYAIITYFMSLVNIKCPRSRKYLNGAPSIIMNEGKFYRKNMKQAKLDLGEFMTMCRQQGYFDLSAIQTAVFEYNGKLTILPVSARRPATPEDLSLAPEQERIFTEVIMDGRILDENLRRMNLDESWLPSQLQRQGIGDAKEVFLGVCDSAKNLVVYKNEAP